jgi:hypothetical protein
MVEAGMGPGSMRALKVAVVAMGIVIVIGTGVLVAVIVKRVTQAHFGGGTPPARVAGGKVQVPLLHAGAAGGSAVLDEPAGTHIVAVGGYGEGLAVTLSGGGPDRVVLLDQALHVIGRITLAR